MIRLARRFLTGTAQVSVMGAVGYPSAPGSPCQTRLLHGVGACTANRRIRLQARAWGRGQVVGLLGATGAVVSGVQWAALEGGHVAAFRQASATAPRAPWIIQARRHGHIGIFKGICSRLGRLDARAWAHAHTHTHTHARTHRHVQAHKHGHTEGNGLE